MGPQRGLEAKGSVRAQKAAAGLGVLVPAASWGLPKRTRRHCLRGTPLPLHPAVPAVGGPWASVPAVCGRQHCASPQPWCGCTG